MMAVDQDWTHMYEAGPSPDEPREWRCDCGCVNQYPHGSCYLCGGGITDSCTCHVSEPDEFGNRDLIEDADCPLHGGVS